MVMAGYVEHNCMIVNNMYVCISIRVVRAGLVMRIPLDGVAMIERSIVSRAQNLKPDR